MKPGIQLAYTAARLAARLRRRNRQVTPLPPRHAEPGISVVIPSRNGRDLLAAQLPGILRELPPAAEVVVVDNGSDDGTADWLKTSFPQAAVTVSPQPLSFARAANRGLEAARYSRVCLLNNDMLIDPGFFAALDHAFDCVPGLFCATAQIRFPQGLRREETGKAVMAQTNPEDFPLRCDEPLPEEDLTYVLYGSGGCSLYDAHRLRELGGFDPIYEPAYVEDLDIGFRAWQRGWPSVYVAGAGLEHRHRATTSRYYSPRQLEQIMEVNYLKFLARSVWAPATHRRLWTQALDRLRLRSDSQTLREGVRIARLSGPAEVPVLSEDQVLALTNGSVFVFPGHAPTGKPRTVLTAACSQHERRTDRDEILVALTDSPTAPPPELRASYLETVLIQKGASADLSFQAALDQTIRKWRPQTVEGKTKPKP